MLMMLLVVVVGVIQQDVKYRGEKRMGAGRMQQIDFLFPAECNNWQYTSNALEYTCCLRPPWQPKTNASSSMEISHIR